MQKVRDQVCASTKIPDVREELTDFPLRLWTNSKNPLSNMKTIGQSIGCLNVISRIGSLRLILLHLDH